MGVLLHSKWQGSAPHVNPFVVTWLQASVVQTGDHFIACVTNLLKNCFEVYLRLTWCFSSCDLCQRLRFQSARDLYHYDLTSLLWLHLRFHPVYHLGDKPFSPQVPLLMQ